MQSETGSNNKVLDFNAKTSGTKTESLRIIIWDGSTFEFSKHYNVDFEDHKKIALQELIRDKIAFIICETNSNQLLTKKQVKHFVDAH